MTLCNAINGGCWDGLLKPSHYRRMTVKLLHYTKIIYFVVVRCMAVKPPLYKKAYLVTLIDFVTQKLIISYYIIRYITDIGGQ